MVAVCPRDGTVEKIPNGVARDGGPKWACKECRRRSNERYRQEKGSAQKKERTIERAAAPKCVPEVCECSDRLGDNPLCVIHEDFHV